MSLNKVIVTGRFSRDVEIKQTQSGKSVLSATLACNRDYTTGDHPETDWIDIVAWEKTAEFLGKYFFKGSEVCIEGRLQTRNYEDKEGNKRKVVEVIVEKAHFVGKKSDGSPNSNIPGNTRNLDIAPDYGEDEDLPF